MTDLSSTTRLPGFEEAYRAESRRLFVERARFLLWSALVLYLTFGVLDLAVAREQAGTFLLIRLALPGVFPLGVIPVSPRGGVRLGPPLALVRGAAPAPGL